MDETADIDVLGWCKVTLRRNGTMSFETPDDEIVGRGMIDALRAHFDEKMRTKRFERVLGEQQIQAMRNRLANGGRG